MREKALRLLGLMRRANAIAVGEEQTGAAARSGKAKLLLLAADASENAGKRAAAFAARGDLPLLTLPFTKEELSAGLGLRGCSMAAPLDQGFSAALLKLLREIDPELCPGAAPEAHERNMRIGKRRNNV